MIPHFYVDESGNFDDPFDPVAVGGVLLWDFAVAIRATIERALPGCPWPLHAAHLHFSVTAPLVARARVTSDAALVNASFREALRLLSGSNGVLVRRCLNALRHDVWPSWADLRDLDESLYEQDQNLWRLLERDVLRVSAIVTRVLGSVNGAVIIAAEARWHITDVTGAPERTSDSATDRYYAGLAVSLARAREIAAARGHKAMRLTILRRAVFDRVQGRRRPLDISDVRELVRGLRPSSCAIDVLPVAAWTAEVPAGCVVADLVANRGRRVLREPAHELARVERKLSTQIPLEVRSGKPARSHLTAVFPPGADFSGHSGEMAPIGIRQWAWDVDREDRLHVVRSTEHTS